MFFSFKNVYFYFVYANVCLVYGMSVDVYCVHIPDIAEVQKRALNPLEMELYTVVSWNVDARR